MLSRSSGSKDDDAAYEDFKDIEVVSEAENLIAAQIQIDFDTQHCVELRDEADEGNSQDEYEPMQPACVETLQ